VPTLHNRDEPGRPSCYVKLVGMTPWPAGQSQTARPSLLQTGPLPLCRPPLPRGATPAGKLPPGGEAVKDKNSFKSTTVSNYADLATSAFRLGQDPAPATGGPEAAPVRLKCVQAGCRWVPRVTAVGHCRHLPSRRGESTPGGFFVAPDPRQSRGTVTGRQRPPKTNGQAPEGVGTWPSMHRPMPGGDGQATTVRGKNQSTLFGLWME
jgi:hypothetical protein